MAVNIFTFVLLIVPVCSTLFGTSERQKDFENVAVFNEIVENKEHIREELENLYTEEEVKKMQEDEIVFTFFSSHDSNQDNHLDGLELFKSILHERFDKEMLKQNQGYAGEKAISQNDQDLLKQKVMNDTEELVDQLLEKFDPNVDGLLDYTEFMKAYLQNKEKL